MDCIVHGLQRVGHDWAIFTYTYKELRSHRLCSEAIKEKEKKNETGELIEGHKLSKLTQEKIDNPKNCISMKEQELMANKRFPMKIFPGPDGFTGKLSKLNSILKMSLYINSFRK